MLMQQMFHRAVILIVEHSSGTDVGLILNRPSAVTMSQLGQTTSIQ